MDATHLLIAIVGSFSGLGVLIAGAGYGYGQFKKGQKNVDDESIASLERQIKIITTEMTELKRENKELVAINNQLQGQLQTYKEIATNQNPEMKEVLRVLSEVIPTFTSTVQYCQSRNGLKVSK